MIAALLPITCPVPLIPQSLTGLNEYINDMKQMIKGCLMAMGIGMISLGAQAQLSTNPNKFLGNITTRGNVEAGGGLPQYDALWNQITCENESKWASVEGTRGSFNWSGADRAFNYALQHNFTHKFHALVWGAQYPNWLESLSAKERFNAITNWFDHAKAQYETLPMIDVVNEAIGNHQQGNPMMKESLGGGGKTGHDWLIKAFEMAYERWPDAILIYNDYNSFTWDLDNYIDLVSTLRNAGAPIDAYGNQSHDVTDISAANLKNAMKKQQDALQMPMFITELDIDIANDAQQKKQYEEIFPLMWEADYCAGVTLWGYVHGATWVSNSGLYKNGVERPAMTWLKDYMASAAARNAAGPLPGTKKEASVYIRPAALRMALNDVMPVKVRARMATKTIEKIDLYANDELVTTMTKEPYVAEYTASSVGKKTLKAVVTTTDGSTYERLSQIQVSRGEKREPYREAVPELPGTIQAEEYDKGLSGVSYGNMDVSRDQFSTTDTKDNSWMEYTVDVKEDGFYTMEVEIASTKGGGMLHLAEYSLDNLTFFTDLTEVPTTGGTTDFKTLRCPLKEMLTAGRHVLTLLVDKGGFRIKSLTFKRTPTFSLPCTVEAEDYFAADGMDIVSNSGGYALGSTAVGNWAEYSIDVPQTGKYNYEVTVSSVAENAKFSMVLIDGEGNEKTLANVSVPQTGSLDTYEVKAGKIRNTINEGRQKLRITITGGSCNIDKIAFVSTETGINEGPDPDFYIYICFGQSNMEGNAQWEPQDEGNVDERFQMLATCDFDNPKRTLGNWYKAECPIVSPVGKLGPSDYFGRTMVKELPGKKIGVIAVAMGGSPIEMFDKDLYEQKLAENPSEWWAQLATRYYGGNPYGRIIEMARKAQEAGVIKGILLHQGESNNGDSKWPGMVKKIYKDMLRDLGLRAADVHLFVGETEYAEMGGGCSWHNTVVAQIPDVIPTGHVVSAKDIPGNGIDPWHFSAQGYRTLGQRYAEVVLDVMNHPEAYTKNWTIDERLTGSLSNLSGKTFAIVNEAEGKAFYGSIAQDLGYDQYGQAFDLSNEGYLFKISRITGGRALKLVTPDGEEYETGGSVGYLNSQAATGDCCFINGLNNQRGYDISDGAVWDIQYVEGKGWTLKNIGTGKYLKDATAAKYDEPTYFTFCTLKEDTPTGIHQASLKKQERKGDNKVYNLAGQQVDANYKGIVIINGKKVMR